MKNIHLFLTLFCMGNMVACAADTADGVQSDALGGTNDPIVPINPGPLANINELEFSVTFRPVPSTTTRTEVDVVADITTAKGVTYRDIELARFRPSVTMEIGLVAVDPSKLGHPRDPYCSSAVHYNQNNLGIVLNDMVVASRVLRTKGLIRMDAMAVSEWNATGRTVISGSFTKRYRIIAPKRVNSVVTFESEGRQVQVDFNDFARVFGHDRLIIEEEFGFTHGVLFAEIVN